MTNTNLNAKQTNASGSGELLPPSPSSSPSAPLVWCNGSPVIPDGVSYEEFFDLASPLDDFQIEQLMEADREEFESELALYDDYRERELSRLQDLGVNESYGLGLQNPKPCNSLGNIGKIQANVGNQGFTARYAIKLISREEIKLRYRMMAFIKDALRPICSWKAPVMNCSTTPIGDHVVVYRTSDDGKPSAKFGPVVHDKNTWVCPLCSFNIAVGRARELREIVYRAKKMDMECYHMTVTMSHHEWDDLSEMLKDMRKALHSFWGQRRVKDRFKSWFVHRVSAMEITKGFDQFSNGWHPHLHILLIGSKGVPFAELQEEYSEEWLKALHKVGRDGRDGIALQIKPVSSIEGYLTKLPCEIALNNVTKSGHGSHMTFFQMVNYAVNSDSSAVRAEIAEYVRQYYKATKGMHQLQKSRGINKYFGVEEKSDDQLANQDSEKVVRELIVVDAKEWRSLSHDDICNIWTWARRGEVGRITGLLHKKGLFMHWGSEDEYIAWHNKFYGG